MAFRTALWLILLASVAASRSSSTNSSSPSAIAKFFPTGDGLAIPPTLDEKEIQQPGHPAKLSGLPPPAPFTLGPFSEGVDHPGHRTKLPAGITLITSRITSTERFKLPGHKTRLPAGETLITTRITNWSTPHPKKTTTSTRRTKTLEESRKVSSTTSKDDPVTVTVSRPLVPLSTTPAPIPKPSTLSTATKPSAPKSSTADSSKGGNTVSVNVNSGGGINGPIIAGIAVAVVLIASFIGFLIFRHYRRGRHAISAPHQGRWIGEEGGTEIQSIPRPANDGRGVGRSMWDDPMHGNGAGNERNDGFDEHAVIERSAEDVKEPPPYSTSANTEAIERCHH